MQRHADEVHERLGEAVLFREELRVALEAMNDEIADLRRAADEICPRPRRGKGCRIEDHELRAAAANLGEFTASEFARALRCSPAAAQRGIERLMEAGMARDAEKMRSNGPGRPAKIFAYVKPVPQGLIADRRDRPGRRRRYTGFGPAGRRAVHVNKDFDRLVGAAHRDGFEARITGGNRVMLERDGVQPVVLPMNPEDRTLKNKRAELRRVGVAV